MKILIVLFLFGAAVVPPLEAQTSPWVTAYYAGWQQGNQWSYHLRPQDIDYGAVTHIIHFSLGPKEDGTLDDVGNNVVAENASTLIALAHAAGKKVLICVGGWNSESGFGPATLNPIRARFITNLLALVKSRGYDGIDIDWEPVSPQYHRQYALFIQDLRAAMTAMNPNLLLTAATQAEPAMFAGIHQLLNQINLMTYDLSGAWPSWVTWHNSPVYNGGYRFPSTGGPLPCIDDMVNKYIAAGIPKSKLGIGVDFYGYTWNGGNGTTTGGVTAPRQEWRVAPWVKDNVPYHQIMETFYQPQYYRWDSAAEAAYLSIDSAGSPEDKFISYDDETACRKKIEYTKNKGIGGVILWELGGGWRPNASPHDPLLQAVKRAAQKK
jgi:chitinase